MIRKLKSKKGESLAETMIAVLISALGLLMLASMIEHGSRLIAQSNNTIQTYVREENEIIELQDGETTTATVSMVTPMGSVMPIRTGSVQVNYKAMPSHPDVMAYSKAGD